MSIRPMDMQIATARSLEHHEGKQNVLHRADIAHDNANAQVEKEEIKKRSSVNHLDKGSDSRAVRDEEEKKRKKREAENRGKGTGKSKNPEKITVKDKDGNVLELPRIDIKI